MKKFAILLTFLFIASVSHAGPCEDLYKTCYSQMMKYCTAIEDDNKDKTAENIVKGLCTTGVQFQCGKKALSTFGAKECGVENKELKRKEAPKKEQDDEDEDTEVVSL